MKPDQTEMPYLTSNPQWIRGFNTGIIFTLMSQHFPVIGGLVNRLDEETIFMMAQRMGYQFTWHPVDETWTKAEFELIEANDA